MLRGLRKKFSCLPYYDLLLNTGEQFIYEASPTDAIWGLWNPDTSIWTGLNLLGKALMQVRQALIN
jgi:predicted NAD-dependent protein-ADP-ribosyltransferase YbiA (DUF1768 family)